MAEYYESLFQWNEPEKAGGKRHEAGEIAEIDPVKVFDLADLVKNGTVRKVAPPAPVEESTPWQHLGASVAAGERQGADKSVG